MNSILLKDGLIINGLGNPGFFGSIYIKNNKVSILRKNHNKIDADIEIDCTNKVISPGFIDLHSHSSLTIFGEPKHEPKVFQGVTTELVGIDGVSPVPFKNKKELERYIWLDSGFNDYPPKIDWLKTVEYLSNALAVEYPPPECPYIPTFFISIYFLVSDRFLIT